MELWGGSRQVYGYVSDSPSLAYWIGRINSALRDTQKEGKKEGRRVGRKEEEKEMETVIKLWPQRTLRERLWAQTFCHCPTEAGSRQLALSKRRLGWHFITPDSSVRIIRCFSWPWSLELISGLMEFGYSFPVCPGSSVLTPWSTHWLITVSYFLYVPSLLLFSSKWGEVGGLDDEGHGTFLWLLIKSRNS